MAGIVRKAPKVPAWKKPIKNVKPKLPTSGHYGPSIYNPSGRNQAFTGPLYKGTPSIPPSFSPHLPPKPSTPEPIYSGDRGGMGSSLINGDWEVQEAESNLAAMMGRARGDFKGGFQQAFIDYGGADDVSKLGSLGQYVDAETIRKAVENKYSTIAQNKQAATRSRDVNNATLAARGLLPSGATVKAQQDVSNQQEALNYQGLRGLLESGQQGLTNLADMEAQGAREIAQARFAAAQRAADQYPGAFGNFVTPNESGFVDPRAALGIPTRTGVNQLGTSNRLTRQQFLKKNPRGQYANYLRAFNRHIQQQQGTR